MVNLNGKILAALALPVPPPAEQRHYAEKARSLRARQVAEKTELLKLRTLKRGLMDDLLTGRVRVKVADEAAT